MRYIILSLFVTLWLILCLLSGCATRNPVTDAQSEHIRRITELEDANAELAARLSKYDSAVTVSIGELEALGTRAGDIAGEVDRIISLFGQYERAVQQTIQRLKDAGSTTESPKQGTVGFKYHFDNYGTYEDNWVYLVREGR